MAGYQWNGVTRTALPSYRAAAERLWGEAGTFIHDAYDRHRKLYRGLPPSLPMVIGISAYGRAVGLCRMNWTHGPRITVASWAFKYGSAVVDDVVVHEMLHAYLKITGRDPDHDSDDWYAEIRRLSPIVLGHPLEAHRGRDLKSVRIPNPDYVAGNGAKKTLVRKARVDAGWCHKQIAGWPGTFRPEEWDRGRVIDVPSY